MNHASAGAALESAKGRLKLGVRSEPYWRAIGPGFSLGYRKSRLNSSWFFRSVPLRPNERLRQIRIGEADDKAKADGIVVLSFRQALTMALRCLRKGIQPANPRKKAQYTVGEAARDYLQNYVRDGFSSVARTQNLVEFHILPTMSHIPVQSLTHEDVRRWVQSILSVRATSRHYHGGPRTFHHVPLTDEGLRQRKQTANRALQVLKAMLNQALREGRVSCSGSAWREFRYFTGVRVGLPRFLTFEDQRMLVAACEGDFRLLVMGALYTGARFGELIQLRVEDFRLDAIHVPASIAKTRRPRIISLEKHARTFFHRMTAGRHPEELLFTLSGAPWRSDDQWRCMRSATLKAEITDIRFRDLRNTAASNWLRVGMPLRYISEQLGNSMRTCELHYAHVSPTHRSNLFFKLPTNCIDGMEEFPVDLSEGSREETSDLGRS